MSHLVGQEESRLVRRDLRGNGGLRTQMISGEAGRSEVRVWRGGARRAVIRTESRVC